LSFFKTKNKLLNTQQVVENTDTSLLHETTQEVENKGKAKKRHVAPKPASAV